MEQTQETTDLFVVTLEEAGQRLDKLLPTHFPQHSRSYFQYLIENGSVLVNGVPIKKRDKPEEGDEIEVCFLLTPEINLEPQDIPLDILYEDDHLIVINKPVGMVVHPAPGHPNGTFVNALLFHCQNLETKDSGLRPGIVHRLDKDTSGILIAAKTSETHQKLVACFSERKIQKHYLAITVGNPGDGLIDQPIGRHPVHRKQMKICIEKGREAKSVCRVLAKNERLAVVEIHLITGRTHQIRVHLKHKNAPVLGDPIYGADSANKQYKVERQLLHAHRISFEHPITKKPLNLVAPIPKDLLTFMETLNYQWEGNSL